MNLLSRSLLEKMMPAIVLCIGLSLGTMASLAQQESESPQVNIDQLVQRLGDDDYRVRQQAQDELAQLGFEACDALTAAVDHEDLEIASRAKYLLRLMQVEWITQSDLPEVKDLLRNYPYQSAEGRRQRMRSLAALPGGIGLPALCRLARFEKSVLLSKHAALEILDIEPADETGRQHWAQTVRENLGPSRRPAVAWLSAYLKLAESPRAALAELAALAEAERARGQHASGQSSQRIVTSLLYHLASAYAAQDEQKSADKTAQEAREFFPRTQSAVLQFAQFHLQSAMELSRRGKFSWAELEHRLVIATEMPEAAAIAQRLLSEMLHDQGDSQQAAELLADSIRLIDEKKLRGPPEDRARLVGRMNYFRSCQYAEQGNRQKQREHLDRALEADPAELDSLIARHRLPPLDAEYRKETSRLIEKAADLLARQIRTSPDEPQNYNQFAWLVGNTEGDSDEALRCAKIAVEMAPSSGAYFDTLGHVYCGRGEYAAAVKYQLEAVRLEPHSGLIVKQLAFFRQKLKEKQAADEASDDPPLPEATVPRQEAKAVEDGPKPAPLHAPVEKEAPPQ